MHELIACGFYKKTTPNGKKVFDNSYKNALALAPLKEVRHKLSLLSEYRNRAARFKVPALWVDAWCQRCFVSFTEMVKWRRVIQRDTTSL